MKFYEKKRPRDDELSGFRIFIPKDWEEAPESIIRNTIHNGRIQGEIAKYYSDPFNLDKSEVIIEAFELKHHISAKNWLIRHMLNYGYIMEGLRDVNWDRAEGLGVIYNDKTIDYKDRLVAILNGRRVILLTYSSPLYVWEEEKALQATVTKSFNILKVDDTLQNEMVSYDITGYADFKYPSNFRVGMLNQKDFDRPSIRLMNMEDINSHVTNRQIPMKRKETFKGNY